MAQESYLLDWMILYLKNRDLVTRSLVGIEKKADYALITYKTKKRLVLCEPFLVRYQSLLDKAATIPDAAEIHIACFNTLSNIDKTVDEWSTLIAHRHLILTFVNPFGEHQKQWTIWPATHHRITEDASLKLGLLSMAEGVGIATEQELKEKCH